MYRIYLFFHNLVLITVELCNDILKLLNQANIWRIHETISALYITADKLYVLSVLDPDDWVFLIWECARTVRCPCL